ncbi:hypothetical protein QO009_002994 [Brevibacillus aydinogluensis]|jgi:hypothetical protein|uniref:hypothetical protein n=1 Tax=Brevibacillus aydinogluensis TaxID=927786 RepID=UPI0028932E9F|nr:hypothetical protein [Brevibacillus aydinogluensis]MDT3417099.1 hypothetical protein [Brevibacillus aydinogluensis]
MLNTMYEDFMEIEDELLDDEVDWEDDKADLQESMRLRDRQLVAAKEVKKFRPGMVVTYKRPWGNERLIGIVASVHQTEERGSVYCTSPYHEDRSERYITGAQWPQELKIVTETSDYDHHIEPGQYVWDDFPYSFCVALVLRKENGRVILLHPNGCEYDSPDTFLLRFRDQALAEQLYEKAKPNYICIGDHVMSKSGQVIKVEKITRESYGRFEYHGQGKCFREDRCKKVQPMVIKAGDVQLIDNGTGQLSLF